MAFDINQQMDNIFSEMAKIISTDSEDFKNCVKNSLEKQKQALEKIAKARITNEINDTEMKSHLKDEKLALEASLLACQVKAKMIANKAAKSAIDHLSSAIINTL